MVIGNGMIANTFSSYKDDTGIVIFASGVSNSKDTNPDHYTREFSLLQKIIAENKHKTIVYFSTCSIEDIDLISSPYVIHKKNIENYIKENVENYYLFRVSNLAGISNNPFTLLNFFIFSILKEQPITVWKNAYRNIIGVEDMFAIVDHFLQEQEGINSIINIANPVNYPVGYILDCIEKHLGKKGIYNEIERGDNYSIDVTAIEPVIKKLGIQFNDEYLPSLLKKYYHSK